MKLSLLRIAPGGQTLDYSYAPEELEVSAHAFTLNESVLVKGRVKPSGRDFHVTGELETIVAVNCDRCLCDLFIPVHEMFKLVYVPADEAPPSHGEHEVHEQELEFAYLDGDELDIDQLIREQLELALPSRKLCREDCRGLCVQCGADLNETTCQCTAPIDSRWQALADLKNQNE